MSDKDQIAKFNEALTRLAVGSASMPAKLGPANAALKSAQEKLIPASFALALDQQTDPTERQNRFLDALGTLRLACYSQIRIYNELIELLDTAKKEVTELMKGEDSNG